MSQGPGPLPLPSRPSARVLVLQLVSSQWQDGHSSPMPSSEVENTCLFSPHASLFLRSQKPSPSLSLPFMSHWSELLLLKEPMGNGGHRVGIGSWRFSGVRKHQVSSEA